MRNALKIRKKNYKKKGFVMFQDDPNDAWSQNVMILGLMVAEKKRGHTHRRTRLMFL